MLLYLRTGSLEVYWSSNSIVSLFMNTLSNMIHDTDETLMSFPKRFLYKICGTQNFQMPESTEGKHFPVHFITPKSAKRHYRCETRLFQQQRPLLYFYNEKYIYICTNLCNFHYISLHFKTWQGVTHANFRSVMRYDNASRNTSQRS